MFWLSTVVYPIATEAVATPITQILGDGSVRVGHSGHGLYLLSNVWDLMWDGQPETGIPLPRDFT